MTAKVDWNEVLLDYLEHDLSNADIAEKYDLDPGYVRLRIKKAKESGELKEVKELRAAGDALASVSPPANSDESNVAVIEDNDDEGPNEPPMTAPVSPPVMPPFNPNPRISTGMTPEREREIRQLINSPKDILIQKQVKSEIERRIKQHEKNGKKDAAFRIAMHQQMKNERFRRLGISYKEILQLKGVRI